MGAPCLSPHQLGLNLSLGICIVGLSGAGVLRVELVFPPERLSCPALGQCVAAGPNLGADGRLLSSEWQAEPGRITACDEHTAGLVYRPRPLSELLRAQYCGKHSPGPFAAQQSLLLSPLDEFRELTRVFGSRRTRTEGLGAPDLLLVLSDGSDPEPCTIALSP